MEGADQGERKNRREPFIRSDRGILTVNWEVMPAERFGDQPLMVLRGVFAAIGTRAV
jgi:hypothetical protein